MNLLIFVTQVERLDYAWVTMSIERSCTTLCPYGCRYNGYAITQRKCTDCCVDFGCNTGNEASHLQSLTSTYTAMAVVMSLYVHT